MRYTKYQYKKKSNGINFLTSVVMMILGAGAIGLIVGTMIFNTVWGNKLMKIGGTSQEVVADETVKKEAFESVQCGYFSKEENANKVLESLGKSYNSFVVKDEEKFRVLAGVFTGEEGDKALKELKEKGIEAAKVKFTLDEEDKVQEQISAISDGYFKIVTTLKNNEVKAVSTSEFKGWTKELPEITEGDKKEIIGQFKKHIEELPSELKKENLTDELKYIYTILINFKR
ncbi:SPOR domain-containing protein [Clostridium gasigenes]|uniref:SPOR domain-containing protein n=1 Tax=Clostridium gasigenes TaxID=94869 RepID=UPI00143843D4|nr:SPOR domain-containing protein [Clostridium gasigenes]MBB6622667.1 SPOR domain-containing protein [Clostridium gasigenes]MBU3136623.1 SPOR domain-containing protein [Clostridium gasigenes]NKF06338.1 SPOR domain-containing protein [Clostridium gasigenes]QSW20222.1 SPOR domain-containing protein [Clostridium gasigenes]